jgi:ribosome maturation factor RimP
MINVYTTQQEHDLADQLADFTEKEDYGIVRIRVSKNKKSKKFQIMIERNDGNQISVMDCEKVNKEVLRILRDHSLGLEDYDIEISSPGIDKPLTRLKDYVESKEKLVKISTLYKIQNRRSFKGYLVDVGETSIKVNLTGTNDIVTLDFNSISEAYLQYEF